LGASGKEQEAIPMIREQEARGKEQEVRGKEQEGRSKIKVVIVNNQ
jgi:hypothetical protein